MLETIVEQVCLAFFIPPASFYAFSTMREQNSKTVFIPKRGLAFSKQCEDKIAWFAPPLRGEILSELLASLAPDETSRVLKMPIRAFSTLDI